MLPVPGDRHLVRVRPDPGPLVLHLGPAGPLLVRADRLPDLVLPDLHPVRVRPDPGHLVPYLVPAGLHLVPEHPAPEVPDRELPVLIPGGRCPSETIIFAW